jgi:hypothetical protein
VNHQAYERQLSGRIRYSNPEILPADIETDDHGNITKMPEIDAKPCFGDVITFVLDGNPPKRTSKSGRLWNGVSKCTRCRAYEACSIVTAERIVVDPAIDSAHVAINPARGVVLRAGKRFDAFVETVIKHGPFQSVNDSYMAARKSRDREARRKRYAEQVKRERSARKARGVMDPSFEADVRRRRDVLRDILLAKSGPGKGAPHALRHLKPNDVEMIADVWLGKSMLGYFGKHRININQIAVWLVENGLAQGKDRAGAYKRVQADLERIEKFEAHGGIWSHLTPIDPDVDWLLVDLKFS